MKDVKLMLHEGYSCSKRFPPSAYRGDAGIQSLCKELESVYYNRLPTLKQSTPQMIS